jgi:hypothetical protein
MPKHFKKKKLSHKLIISIVSVLIIAGIVAGIFQLVKNVPSIKEAITIAANPKPETFTELYFEDHLYLPDKINLSEENNFKFTIHNLENKDMEYPYEVYIDINGGKQIIDKNSVLIKSNNYKTIKENFIITIPLQRFRVVVNLINKNQEIDFWMTQK